jgi:DNA-binding NarL/FixJ family response regulator
LFNVLIVDDSAAIRTAIRSRFAGCVGLVVCGEAFDGLDAIEQARTLKPDLILLDISMPRMNGVEAASILKGLLPDVRIIAFTMYADALENSLAAAVGIDAVLSKPEGISRVVDCVRALLPSIAPA